MRPLLALALLAAALPAAGQDRGEQLRLDLMPVSLDRPLALYYRNKGKVEKLEVFHTAMGTPVFYRGPATLAFYRDEADAQPPTGNQPPPPPLATVPLPASCRRVLLVFSAGDDDDDKPSVRAWPVADDRLRAGDYRLINASRTPVAGTLGEQRFSLKPGETTDLSHSAWRERGHDLPVRFAVPRDGRAKVVYSTIWSHYPVRRHYVFFIAGHDGATPVVRKFHDVPAVGSIGYEPETPRR